MSIRRKPILELDASGKAHELDNLDVVDRSVFPSGGAVNPALTIIANAGRGTRAHAVG